MEALQHECVFVCVYLAISELKFMKHPFGGVLGKSAPCEYVE